MSPEESNRQTEEPRPPSAIWRLLGNPISLAGAALAAVALANITFLFLIDVLSEKPSPYIGILAYMVGPAFLVLGLLAIPAGLWWDRRKRRKQDPDQPLRYLRIDFNEPSWLRAILDLR